MNHHHHRMHRMNAQPEPGFPRNGDFERGHRPGFERDRTACCETASDERRGHRTEHPHDRNRGHRRFRHLLRESERAYERGFAAGLRAASQPSPIRDEQE